MTKSMKPICSYCGANYSKKRLQAGYDTCLSCDEDNPYIYKPKSKLNFATPRDWNKEEKNYE